MLTSSARVAVIGGSGFYDFLTDVEEVQVRMPRGILEDLPTPGEGCGCASCADGLDVPSELPDGPW